MNALSRRTILELTAAFDSIKADPNVRGAIITGAGDRAFIAGADISELADVTGVQASERAFEGQTLLNLVENLGKPVVAAINGVALGGGCETALACTVRIAVKSAQFGQPEIKLGLIPGYGGTQRLARLVGRGLALQMILTGSPISAEEALRVGLVTELVEPSDLIKRAEEILSAIAANSPAAIRYAIEAVNRGMEGSLSEGLALERTLFGLCASTDDRKEGVAAFLAKRAPTFSGR